MPDKRLEDFILSVGRFVTNHPAMKVYEAKGESTASLLLWGTGWLVKGMQYCSCAEWLKWYVYGRGRVHPIFLELYLISFWLIFILVVPLLKQHCWPLALALVLGTILQVVQTNIYHEVLRPDWRRDRNESLGVAHSRVRSLLIGLWNYLMVAVAFGYAYWIMSDGFLCNHSITLLDCIYVSFTFAWSAGSEPIPPGSLSFGIKVLLVCQVMTTLALVAIILSIAVGSLAKIEDSKHGEKDAEGGSKKA